MNGVAVFDKKIKGVVKFTQKPDGVIVHGKLQGLKKSSTHAIHIHKFGDLTKKCTSMSGHFNPFNHPHGGRNDKKRHVGDLGNIQSDAQGRAVFRFKDRHISLRHSKQNVIGRGLVIHNGTDDLGKTCHPNSSTTGNAGPRRDCAVIGICR